MAEMFRFAAFLSYTSKDAAFARKLHSALERFRIPTALGRFDLAGTPNRVYPVFRDREELPAGILNDELEAALRASSALVVVCSPNAVKSPWVNAEIRYFRSLGRGDRIFPIIVDGEPNASLAGHPEQECFPEALRDGTSEPLAADARPGKDGFRNAWLKIVAGLLSVNAGVLQDRDRRLRRRQAMMVTAGVVTLLAATAALVGFFDRAGARDAFADRATLFTERGDRAAALPFALAGLGAQKGEEALERLGGRVPLVGVLNARQPNEEILMSPDSGTLATRSGNYDFALWELATGKQRGPLRTTQSFQFANGGHRVVLYNEDHTDIVDTATGALVATLQDVEVARDGDSIFVAGDVVAAPTNNGTVTVWDVRNGKIIANLGTSDAAAPLHLSPSGNHLLACDTNEACNLWNVTTGQKVTDLTGILGVVDMTDTRLASSAETYGKVKLWDATTGASIKDLTLDGEIQYVRFTADGAHLIVSSGSRPALLLDSQTGNTVATLNTIDSGDDALRLAGNRAFVRGLDASGVLWDTTTGKQVAAFGNNAVLVAALSPDARKLVIQSQDHHLSLWDAVRGHKIADLDVTDPVESVVFSAGDGPFLIRTQSAGASFWTSTGQKIEDFGWRGSELDLQISPDATRVAGFAGDGLVEVWNMKHPLVEGEGESLRAAICATDAGAVPPFRVQDRAANDAVGAYLRGRPWRVCDWRGLWSPEGWAQTARYFGVRLGIAPDYRAP